MTDNEKPGSIKRRPRQFPWFYVHQEGDELLVAGNRVALEKLKWLIDAALDSDSELRDECGQTRWALKHGDKSIQITVRKQDVFQKLPTCEACEGKGRVDIVGDGDALDCQECGGFGKKMPAYAKVRLPFLT